MARKKPQSYLLLTINIALYVLNMLLLTGAIGANAIYTLYSRKYDPSFFKEIKKAVVKRFRF
jgi:hypothetical protein